MVGGDLRAVRITPRFRRYSNSRRLAGVRARESRLQRRSAIPMNTEGLMKQGFLTGLGLCGPVLSLTVAAATAGSGQDPRDAGLAQACKELDTARRHRLVT